MKDNVQGTTFFFFHRPGVGKVSSAPSVREIINAASNQKECGVHLRIIRKKITLQVRYNLVIYTILFNNIPSFVRYMYSGNR